MSMLSSTRKPASAVVFCRFCGSKLRVLSDLKGFWRGFSYTIIIITCSNGQPLCSRSTLSLFCVDRLRHVASHHISARLG